MFFIVFFLNINTFIDILKWIHFESLNGLLHACLLTWVFVEAWGCIQDAFLNCFTLFLETGLSLTLEFTVFDRLPGQPPLGATCLWNHNATDTGLETQPLQPGFYQNECWDLHLKAHANPQSHLPIPILFETMESDKWQV